MRRRSLITIGVVASEAGVSASTVSHVLNGRANEARISVATRERVLDVAQRLGYTPNHAAQSLRRQRTGIITVLVWRLSSPLFADIATGVRNVADRHGYHVGVIDAGAVDKQVEVRALRYLRTGISDGIIVATGSHGGGGPALQALLELVNGGTPATLVFERSPTPAIPAIDLDHAGGVYLATKHLLGLGHRRIAHFTFADASLEPESGTSQAARYSGYLKALAEAGIGPDASWLMRGGREIEGGRQMAHDFLERFPTSADRPSAMVAFNDRTAIGALRGFYEVGVRVPEDVAIVGFHDIGTSRYTTPALTTVGHPREELGEMAAEALFKLLEGGSVEARDRIVPVWLTVRESCGAPAPGRLGATAARATAASVTPLDGSAVGRGGRDA
jgi:DNA-binding LacI/PurR family transcriptional regulator